MSDVKLTVTGAITGEFVIPGTSNLTPEEVGDTFASVLKAAQGTGTAHQLPHGDGTWTVAPEYMMNRSVFTFHRDG